MKERNWNGKQETEIDLDVTPSVADELIASIQRFREGTPFPDLSIPPYARINPRTVRRNLLPDESSATAALHTKSLTFDDETRTLTAVASDGTVITIDGSESHFLELPDLDVTIDSHGVSVTFSVMFARPRVSTALASDEHTKGGGGEQ